ncbi:GNAT family N-acetyltransferase [Streptomyces sp. NPDC058953]|uniref:GNAT family N-acetyltransferase n=1 Tax=unclassified Streptomyces TaxID=2593676 RepID=UPI00369190D3
MTITLTTPTPDALHRAVTTLREWQHDESPTQLHPGDLGWYWRTGTEATAAAVRIWTSSGRVLAIGLLDGPDLFRLTTAPDAYQDGELARRLVDDITTPARGVLPPGRVNVETPEGTLVRESLSEAGWPLDDPWTPLIRDLTPPVPAPDPELRIVTVGPDLAEAFTTTHRAAFRGSPFTTDRWHAMATGSPFTEARCLLAYDTGDEPVAVVTVWSAGPSRPGLLEPMGVHHAHRRRGYGEAISVAAAAALRDLGASSALVCTPTANVAAVATYKSAGYRERPEIRDHYRPV